jgi:hypothetical protein
MNRLKFIKGDGGVPKSLPGEDHISGFLMYMPDSSLPSSVPPVTAGFSATDRVKAISSLESAAKYGITKDASDWYVKVLYYHISETLRINPGISLYVGLFETPETYDFEDIKTLQNFAEGKLRQVAVYAPDKTLSNGDLTALQGVAKTLETECAPLSILYACNVSNVTALTNMSAVGQSNVSVVISQDGASNSVGKTLFKEINKSVTTVGLALGTLSLAAVHESIAWVKKFPSGIFTPALADGTLVKEVDNAVITGLDDKRFLFLRTYPGMAGSFWNDSHSMDLPTGDYAYIESVRTIDKAIRGIRRYMLPELSAPLYVDPSSGQLDAGTVTYLELVAGRQLEDMERAGELSGYKVYINPDQNVLATSEVEIVIKKVGVGVMRSVKIQIGFTSKLY